ncbi:MAG TPA: cyclic nucleotide-binding domain-containing protein [Ignavibacteriaceae bacterium]|nr:cyclic nucleotide-binding domain-containing protein [Ignavibacteriaceae bacterium]
MNNNNREVVHSSFWTNFFNKSTEKLDLQKSLLSIPIFEGLSQRDCSMLMSIIHHRIYITDEYVFYQGDPGLGLYLIREGEVEIRRTDKDGDIHIQTHLKRGDFFGELALVDGELRSASAVATADTKLAVIFKPDIDEFIEKFPKKGIKILQGISKIVTSRLRKLNEEHYEIQTKLKSGVSHET